MPRVLLVNPPITDFTGYDFWSRPYGLLTIGGYLRGRANLAFFDALDRGHPTLAGSKVLRCDAWGRGHFPIEELPTPVVFTDFKRRFKRFGLPRELFRSFLRDHGPFDYALIQTLMTYWFQGVAEVLEDVRELSPQCQTILGGVYASLCPEHARSLGPDTIIEGRRLSVLWHRMGVEPDLSQPPLWEAYGRSRVGVLKLTDGCPLQCTYCASRRIHPQFEIRPLERVFDEVHHLLRCGILDVAFYDDALLCRSEEALVPFLQAMIRQGAPLRFHTPNALHPRLLSLDLARLMVAGGVKTFFLGFESGSSVWQERTGNKVARDDMVCAVEHLLRAGVGRSEITAYCLMGHPDMELQDLEESMHFVHKLGIRLMMAEFSPLPGTPDGDRCRKWVDISNPLWHNKTAFTLKRMGVEEVTRMKDLCRGLNEELKA